MDGVGTGIADDGGLDGEEWVWVGECERVEWDGGGGVDLYYCVIEILQCVSLVNGIRYSGCVGGGSFHSYSYSYSYYLSD